MIVREGRLDDVPKAVTYMLDITQKGFYHDMKPSVEMLTLFTKEAIAKPDQYYLRVIEHNDTIIGGFFGHWFYPIFSTDRLAEDFCIWLDDEYKGRCGRQLKALVDGFGDWCKKQEVKKIIVGVIAGIDNDRAASMYERLGYPVVGYIHAKTI